MPQDFGDDIGEMLTRAVGRAAGRAAHHMLGDGRERRDFHERAARERGAGEEEAAREAERLAGRDLVCIPFGSDQDAARFAQVCRENGIWADALADRNRLGYVQFAADDLAQVQGCAPQYCEVMTRQHEQDLVHRLETARPLDEAQLAALTRVERTPEASREAARDQPTRQRPAAVRGQAPQARENHTLRIRDEVREARAQCRDFDGFCRILAAKGIGTTASRNGEVMFYEARVGSDGRLLPYGTDELGRHDWAVGAAALRERWGVDATNDWFAANTPKEPQRGQARDQARQAPLREADGALDADGATPDLEQGIESHDGMDTDATTRRIEREQTGTDVAPSTVREAARAAGGDRDSFATVAQDARRAGEQYAHDRAAQAPQRSMPDRLDPVR